MLTVTWWTLAPGAYFLLSGQTDWGTLLSAVGLVALVVAVSRPLLARFEARVVNRPLALLFALMVIVTALFELWLALSFASASPFSPGLLALHAALLLVGGVAVALQLRQAPGEM
jgi:hypothetical protein